MSFFSNMYSKIPKFSGFGSNGASVKANNSRVSNSKSNSGSCSTIDVSDRLDSIIKGAETAGKSPLQYLEEDLGVPQEEAPTLYKALGPFEGTLQSGGRSRKNRKSRKTRNKKKKNKSRRGRR